MPRRAEMQLEGGPLDGLSIVWPEHAGTFPVSVQFGWLALDEAGDVMQPNVTAYHKYEAYHCYEDGDIDPDDGLPENEYQLYIHET